MAAVIGLMALQASRSSEHPAAVNSDRGREAKSPSEIPARGWRNFPLRVYGRISDHRVLAIAAGVTFYSLLAIFPAIAALVSIYGLFTDPSTIGSRLNQLSGLLPSGAVDVVKDQLSRVSSQYNSTLGLTFFIGLLTALWSANAGVKALFDALNVVYDEQEKRGFIKLNALSLTFTMAAILFMLLALGAVIILPLALGSIGLGNQGNTVVAIARWPVLLVIIAEMDPRSGTA